MASLARARVVVGAGEHQSYVGEGDADGAGAGVYAEEALAWCERGAQAGHVDDGHGGVYGPGSASKPGACFMSLDPATVRRIAKLARIRVEEGDVGRLQGELNGILGWIETLSEVDVAGVEPLTGGAAILLRLRADAVTDGGMAEAVLANAPDRVGAFFTVPKVVE